MDVEFYSFRMEVVVAYSKYCPEMIVTEYHEMFEERSEPNTTRMQVWTVTSTQTCNYRWGMDLLDTVTRNSLVQFTVLW
jgi:hypothetical protein